MPSLFKISIPKSSALYISTKTKIAYLNVDSINLHDVFWKIPILSYHEMKNGVIKKQMKFNLNSEEESLNIDNKKYNLYPRQHPIHLPILYVD